MYSKDRGEVVMTQVIMAQVYVATYSSDNSFENRVFSIPSVTLVLTSPHVTLICSFNVLGSILASTSLSYLAPYT